MGWEYLVAGLALAIVLMQIVPLIRARRMRGRAVPELDAMLNDAQRAQERLLVYFWSPGCGACRPMTPVMDKLAAERGNVLKVNVAQSLALARRFGVMGTPSLALVEKGILKQLVVGARSEPQIRALLQQ
jgi:thioredoxin 1